MAIYRGFAAQTPDLKLLLCAYHLQKNDAQKMRELVRQKEALKISFVIFMVVTTKE